MINSHKNEQVYICTHNLQHVNVLTALKKTYIKNYENEVIDIIKCFFDLRC